ncbi:hypothetical protein GGI21_003504, partial [Coemansia aciculifera]
MLDISRQSSSDHQRRNNARAAAQFAQATVVADERSSEDKPKDVAALAVQSDVSSHGLGSLFMDSLPVLDASRIGRSGNAQAPAAAANATPPPFHALSRILNSGGHTPRSPYSPRRGGGSQAVNSPSGNSSTQNTAAYVPFQDPTVDISNLPKYQDVDLKQHQQQQRGGSVRHYSPYRQHAMQQNAPDSAVSNLYSATPSEIRDVTSAQGSFAFRHNSQRRASPFAFDDDDGGGGGKSSEKSVPTVKYDSSASGHMTASLESLSLSDIGMEMEEEEEEEERGSLRSPPVVSRNGGSYRSAAAVKGGEGPTLRDIYDLLKKTVSSIDAKQEQHIDDDGSLVNVVPRQLQSNQSHHPVLEYQRPAAPTPRRSRHFPSQYRDAAHSDSEDEERMRGGRSDTGAGQSRVRAYLQRYISESAIEQSYAAAAPPPPPPPAVAKEVDREEMGAEKLLVDLLSFVSGGGDGGHLEADLQSVLGRKLPPALAEKLRELAGVLAQATNSNASKQPAARERAEEVEQPIPAAVVVDEAVQTDDTTTQAIAAAAAATGDVELRSELLRLQREILDKFDEYRAEVDQLRNEVRRSSSSHIRSPLSEEEVGPNDSVSVVAASRLSASVPNTARNRQRHMVQWLGRQQQPFTTPTKSVSHVGDRQQSPLARRHGRRQTETVEDDDGGVGLGEPPKRMLATKVADDDDALSDSSTVIKMRSPVDAATLMGSHRKTAHRAVSPWDGHEDLLATREALDSMRNKQRAKDDG